MRKLIFLLAVLLLASCAPTAKQFGYPKGTQMNKDWRTQ